MGQRIPNTYLLFNLSIFLSNQKKTVLTKRQNQKRCPINNLKFIVRSDGQVKGHEISVGFSGVLNSSKYIFFEYYLVH